MKVGDLVMYYSDKSIGIVTKYDGQYYTVLFADTEVIYITEDELEVVSESR